MQYTNNKTKGFNKRSSDKPIDPEQLFTGAKTPEYAVFYYIAYWWVSDLLKDLYKKRSDSTNDKDQETSPYIDRFLREGKDLSNATLPDLAYSKLRDYLWKGYSTNKNSSGYQLTDFDKRLIHKLISKLVDIRNFHSHVWHDNDCLTFDEELKMWVDDMHLLVIDKLSSVYPWETSKYLEENKKKGINFFDKRNGKIFITQEGRNFFLSFFLQKSEMARFLQQRKGCKRNDKPEYRIKHLVYSYFTHRDGATKKRYSVEKTAFSELEDDSKNEILNARQLYKMVSYLNDTPIEVIDTKLFPLFRNGELVENADQMCSFIQEQKLFSKCEFRVFPSEKDDAQIHTLQFNLTGNDYTFQITQKNIHKLILDIIRGGIDEQHFYDKLELYISNRVKFPIVLDEYLSGNGYLEEINEYYNQKLKVDDKVRKILGQIIDKYEKDGTYRTDKTKELKDKLKEESIELNYYDFYFQVGRKPRMEDRFMEFSVNYLIDKKVVPEWEWLVENLDPEEEKTGDSKSSASKSVIKRKNYFFSEIPEGCRLNLGNDHAVVRLKSKPDIIFGIGRNAMRNLMIAHFHNKPIADVLKKIYSDLDLIRNAGKTATPLNFESLQILESVSIPRYLKLMMHDSSTIDDETMDVSIEKAKERIKLLIDDFTNLLKGDVRLNRNAKNEQIIRCYKFFDWKYPNDSKFKFLRKNEYKQISIYHYCIKPDSRKNYLADLRKRLLADIEPHMPKEVNDLLNSSESFDELFQNTLIKAIALLKEWQGKIHSDSKELHKYLSKLGIHVPAEPVPAKSNASNLPLMNRIPFEIHPSSIFKAFNYSRETNPYLTIRGNAKYTKGLIAQHYSYNHYLKLCPDKKLQSKIVGEVNNLHTTDTLLWMMAQQYLEIFTTALTGDISKILKSKYVDSFQVDQLHNLELPVYQTDKGLNKPYKVIVKFRQLDDYMLIAEKPLIKLVDSLFMRLTSDEQLCAAGIARKDDYYQIPYVLVKQEMERVFHGSVIATNFILLWEKTIVEKISKNLKQQKVDAAKNNNSWAYLSIDEVLTHANLDPETKKELKKLRNHAMHTKIPEGWTYQGMLESSRIKNLLGITPESMRKYEKKGDYYTKKALEENRLVPSLV